MLKDLKKQKNNKKRLNLRLFVIRLGFQERILIVYQGSGVQEKQVRVGGLGARLTVRGVEQPLVAGLYADGIVLFAESEGQLKRIVDEFDRIYRRRKLKVNAGKRLKLKLFVCI